MENRIQYDIIRAYGMSEHARLFRNNVGNFWSGRPVKSKPGIVALKNPRRVQCGLANGSGDLIGIRTITIREEDVGKQIGQFVSLEVKGERTRTKDEQIAWAEFVRKRGGLAGIVRTIEEAEAILEGRGK